MCFVLPQGHGLIMHADRAPTSYRTLHWRAAICAPRLGSSSSSLRRQWLCHFTHCCTFLRVKPTVALMCRYGSSGNAGLERLLYQRRGKGTGEATRRLWTPNRLAYAIRSSRNHTFYSPANGQLDSRLTKEWMAWESWLNAACLASRLGQLAYQLISSKQAPRAF